MDAAAPWSRTPAAGFLLAALCVAGCSVVTPWTGSELHVTSLGQDRRTLSASFQTRLYARDDAKATTVIVSDIPADRLIAGDFADGQIFHLELLWVPKAGSTPMDRTATNASIRHVIFAGGEVGVYGGAGFVLPQGKLGGETLTLQVRQASLSLLDATDGFIDLLTPAALDGQLTVTRSDAQTRRLYFNISQHVTDALGRSRFVQGPASPRLSRR